MNLVLISSVIAYMNRQKMKHKIIKKKIILILSMIVFYQKTLINQIVILILKIIFNQILKYLKFRKKFKRVILKLQKIIKKK